MKQLSKEGCDHNIYGSAMLNYLDEKFSQTIQNCPGCLYNCNIMEETLGLSRKNPKSFLVSLAFMLLEIPTAIQMAKVMENRKR